MYQHGDKRRDCRRKGDDGYERAKSTAVIQVCTWAVCQGTRKCSARRRASRGRGRSPRTSVTRLCTQRNREPTGGVASVPRRVGRPLETEAVLLRRPPKNRDDSLFSGGGDRKHDFSRCEMYLRRAMKAMLFHRDRRRSVTFRRDICVTVETSISMTCFRSPGLKVRPCIFGKTEAARSSFPFAEKANRFSIWWTPRTTGTEIGHLPQTSAAVRSTQGRPDESRGRIQIARTPRLLYASRYKVPAFPLPRSLFLPRSGDSRARGIVLLLLPRSDIICEQSYDLNKFSLHLFKAPVVSAASRERNRFSSRADAREPCNYDRRVIAAADTRPEEQLRPRDAMLAAYPAVAACLRNSSADQ